MGSLWYSFSTTCKKKDSLVIYRKNAQWTENCWVHLSLDLQQVKVLFQWPQWWSFAVPWHCVCVCFSSGIWGSGAWEVDEIASYSNFSFSLRITLELSRKAPQAYQNAGRWRLSVMTKCMLQASSTWNLRGIFQFIRDMSVNT